MQIRMNKLNQAYQCKITCLEEKNLHLNFMWSFGGNFFGLQNPTNKTKSDIYILKCIEGGGSTDLGNIPKNAIFFGGFPKGKTMIGPESNKSLPLFQFLPSEQVSS